MHQKFSLILLAAVIFLSSCEKNQLIDRHDLVTRHNPVINQIDSLDVLTVGNGNFAFTVDATGLQTFPEYYEQGIPLGTQSNWAWHSFPNDENYHLSQVTQKFNSCADSVPYVYRYSNGEKGDASEYLRQNPHRLHLGLIGYQITKTDGEEIELIDVKNIDFQMDMWTGEVSSTFNVEGVPVATTVFAHQDQDQIAVQVKSPLIQTGRLKIRLRFPYGIGCHRCGGYDLTQPDRHTTEMDTGSGEALFSRQLDSTRFFIKASWSPEAEIQQTALHDYSLVPAPESDQFEFAVSFAPDRGITNANLAETRKNNKTHWQQYWQSGGAIEFSGSTDPRASELERRVILSQYLTKIQSTGNLPPQETGLTFNSWYGKFHLEMHWWHAVHFMLWNRPELMSSSLDWYREIMPNAIATAEWQGYKGARWPKMVGPDGVESPSGVGPFLVWQQPHPIYYAELYYRQDSSEEVLERFKEVVFETADFMASFAWYNDSLDQYDLCPPLIPAQEVFSLSNTYNPSFELNYWYYALQTAQQWRQRLGMPANTQWQEVIDKLAELPHRDGLYLPHQNRPDAFTDAEYRRDHPIVTGISGFLPLTDKVDEKVMAATFDEVWSSWNWDRTWGWDYPLMAMSAARLGKPEQAVDALFMDVQKNTYLTNGHNYQDQRLSIYLPGNGGLLTAVAMMVAGWDGAPDIENPGFPANGKWNIRSENLKVMP